jgi:LysM repeat protein
MSLQKATLQRLDANLNPIPGERLTVSYNPTEITFSKGVQYAEIGIPGLDTPIQQFVRGQTETLTFDLFFDTTESGMGAGPEVTAVTTLTDQFYELIKIDPDTKAPPICFFSWGESGFPGSNLTGPWARQRRENGFQCLVESINQKFNLFSPLGVPLRATITVKLREYQTLAQQVAAIDTRVYVAQAGDTLESVAGDYYDDPEQWRGIAEHNGIDDPANIPPGTTLEIPPRS